MDKWIKFYESFFGSLAEAQAFVAPLEALRRGSDSKHAAKIMMHQTARLVSLADDLPQIRKNNETLQLVFLLICAEHIAKLHDDFDDEGQSRAFVRRFFATFVEGDDRAKMESSFTNHNLVNLPIQQAVDALYDVRCDVVHEGKYWGFHFRDDDAAMLNTELDITVGITLEDFRRIVVRGCISAINSYLSA